MYNKNILDAITKEIGEIRDRLPWCTEENHALLLEELRKLVSILTYVLTL